MLTASGRMDWNLAREVRNLLKRGRIYGNGKKLDPETWDSIMDPDMDVWNIDKLDCILHKLLNENEMPVCQYALQLLCARTAYISATLAHIHRCVTSLHDVLHTGNPVEHGPSLTDCRSTAINQNMTSKTT